MQGLLDRITNVLWATLYKVLVSGAAKPDVQAACHHFGIPLPGQAPSQAGAVANIMNTDFAFEVAQPMPPSVHVRCCGPSAGSSHTAQHVLLHGKWGFTVSAGMLHAPAVRHVCQHSAGAMDARAALATRALPCDDCTSLWMLCLRNLIFCWHHCTQNTPG